MTTTYQANSAFGARQALGQPRPVGWSLVKVQGDSPTTSNYQVAGFTLDRSEARDWVSQNEDASLLSKWDQSNRFVTKAGAPARRAGQAVIDLINPNSETNEAGLALA
jgi:hypothetical protein